MKATSFPGFHRQQRKMLRAVRAQEGFALARIAAECGLQDDESASAWDKARAIRAQRARATV